MIKSEVLNWKEELDPFLLQHFSGGFTNSEPVFDSKHTIMKSTEVQTLGAL